MHPEICIFPDYQSLSLAAAARFTDLAIASIQERAAFIIATSGGNTPQGMYGNLSKDFKDKIDWSKVHFYWCDERCVPPGHPESNYGQTRRSLLDFTNVPTSNIHRIRGELDGTEAATQYMEELKKGAFSPHETIRFNLVVLGLGEDGHIASLFPGINYHFNVIVQSVQVLYQDRPADRVTLTPSALNNTDNILFLVSGSGKSLAVRAALQEAYDPLHKPAQRIHPVDGKITWMLDKQAASLLSSME